MQKLAKRVAQAQRQSARRAQQALEKERIATKRRYRLSEKEANEEIRKHRKEARLAALEDWEKGPLAPKRDLGFNDYGLVNSTLRQDWTGVGARQRKPSVLEQRSAWAGGIKQLNLAPGDRVVIMDGPDQGKIDKIASITLEDATVKLENCHKALTRTLDVLSIVAMPLPISSVRLVYPLRNPETGITRDVIIQQLKAVAPNMRSENMTYERWEYGKKWDRYVPGINVTIPWPEVKVPDHQTTRSDTPRDELESRTFHYNLSPPMPGPVLDELRNKYSKFRTRHEPAYIQKKEAQEARKKARAEAYKLLRTPLDEFHDMKREARALMPEPELSDAMLEKIGQVMARKQAAASPKAGAEKTATAS